MGDLTISLSYTIAGGANRAAVAWWLENSTIPMISIARQTGIPLARVYSASFKPKDVEAIARVLQAARPAKDEPEWGAELQRLKSRLVTAELQARVDSEKVQELEGIKREIGLIEFALSPLPAQWANIEGYGITSDPRALTCKRCGAKWLPRKENPRECPRCQSIRWNA